MRRGKFPNADGSGSTPTTGRAPIQGGALLRRPARWRQHFHLTKGHPVWQPPHPTRPARPALPPWSAPPSEWYDFLIYGTAAALVLNSQFFPNADPTVGTLAAFATYAVGFLARPLGGIVLGNMGDKLGRKKMLIFTIVLMGAGHHPDRRAAQLRAPSVWWAPILLILLRLVAGLRGRRRICRRRSAFRRTRRSEAPRPGRCLGADRFRDGHLALDRGVPDRHACCPRPAFQSWGWRVPFLLGAVLLAVGYFIRRSIDETEAYENAVQAEAAGIAQETKIPVLESIRRESPELPRRHRRSHGGERLRISVPGVRRGIRRQQPRSGAQYHPAGGGDRVCDPGGVHPDLGAPERSDRSSARVRRGALLSVLWLVPFFLLLETLSTPLLILGFVVGLGILYPAMLAPQAAYFAELFDTRTRLSGFAFAREIGSVLAGGFLPLIATALIAAFGHWWVIVVYLGILTALTLIALAYGPETNGREIIEPGTVNAPEPQSTMTV